MSLSLALGIVSIVNLAVGYALALMIDDHQRKAAIVPISPSEVPSEAPPRPREAATSELASDPPAIVAEVSPPVPSMKEPCAARDETDSSPAADGNTCAEQLLQSAAALAQELNQFACPTPESAVPQAILGDAAQLEAAINEWWRNDPERTRPVCLGQIEIDNLRQLTVRFGATAMCQLAKNVEQLVLGTLRQSDRVATLGRSRFLAFLPDLDGPSAANLLEAIRVRVEASEFASDDGPIRTTLSAAAAQARSDESVESFLARSAAALREAAAAGRNRVACDDGIAVTLLTPGEDASK